MQITREMCALQVRLNPKSCQRRPSGKRFQSRRPYKDLSLLQGFAETQAARVADFADGAGNDVEKDARAKMPTERAKTPAERWEEWRQSQVDTILQLRKQGVITDAHLRQSPRLVAALRKLQE